MHVHPYYRSSTAHAHTCAVKVAKIDKGDFETCFICNDECSNKTNIDIQKKENSKPLRQKYTSRVTVKLIIKMIKNCIETYTCARL